MYTFPENDNKIVSISPRSSTVEQLAVNQEVGSSNLPEDACVKTKENIELVYNSRRNNYRNVCYSIITITS